MSGAIGDLAIGIGAIGVAPSQPTPLPIPMAPTPPPQTTIIPSLSAEQFAARLADLFPRGWASDDAKQGGNVHALLLGVGTNLETALEEVRYAFNAQRISTETFPELDFASVDFLGNTLPRPSGATDTAFGKQIIASLFGPANTRAALKNALTQLTGTVPRMLEPWNISDTGVWGHGSYWGVDTVASPARWGNGGLRYQGFIETPPPAVAAIGPNNPILTWNTAYWNVPGYFFGIIQQADRAALNNLINRLKAYGTVIWVRLVARGNAATSVPPGAVGSLAVAPAGSGSAVVTWTAPTVGTAPFTFSVLYRPTGTSSFAAGPSVATTSATVPNLTPGTVYDFAVISRNAGGAATSPIVSAATGKVPPTPATNLSATRVQTTAVTLLWQQPSIGTPPFSYTINYRTSPNGVWQTFPVGTGVIGVTVIGLAASTAYDFEVITSN